MLRARIGITSEAVIEIGAFCRNDVTYKILNAKDFALPDEASKISDNYRIVDIVFEADEANDTSFTKSLDLIDTLFDSISYIGYSNISLSYYYSLSPLETQIGEIFKIIVPQYTINKQQNPISIDSIKNINITNENKNALRLLRNALNSHSSEERYISLYSALEWMAEHSSKETIIQKCEQCGYKKDTGRKATRNHLKSIFKLYGKSSKQADKYNSARAKIAHGTGTRNAAYLSQITEFASHLEEILIQELDKLVNIKKSNSGNVIVSSMPYFTHECSHDSDGSFTLISSNWTAPIKFTNLKSRENKSSMTVGAPLGENQEPIIHPISWPNFQNT